MACLTIANSDVTSEPGGSRGNGGIGFHVTNEPEK